MTGPPRGIKPANKALGLLFAVGAITTGALLAALGGSRDRQATVVRIRLIDTESGKPTPAMVCISDARDGTVRVPPDGQADPEPNTTVEFRRGVPFSRGKDWVGPVRKTTGKGNNDDRSFVYGQLPSLPYWSDPVMYQTPSDFTIRLPAGRWRISVQHGMEYIPVTQEFTTSGGTLEKTIRLERWIDLPSEGWFSGDVHVHHPTTEKSHRDYLLEYARAEDVHVVNILEQHHHGGSHSKQWGFGKKFRVERHGRWLVSGQEAPSSTFGHIIGLNVDRLVHDPENVDLYDLAFRGIHESKQALVGYAHFSQKTDLPRGFPWYVTTEEIDFVELMQFAKINAPDYHDYLNLGFRLTAAAGSDVPWGSTLGEVRTFVYTGETFDPDRWFAALKAGRTFVSNGPALMLTVDGELPGTTLRKARDTKARIRARVRSHAKIGLVRTLKVMSNEGVLKEVKPQGSKTELTIDFEIPLSRSRWIVASAECSNGALAHTSPVYVIVDSKPAWCPERGPEIIDKQLAAIGQIEKEFASRNAAILTRLKRAREYYSKLEAAMKAGRE